MGAFVRPQRESQVQEDRITESNSPPSTGTPPFNEKRLSKYPSAHNPSSKHVLPTSNYNGRLVTKGINPEGESGRSGFHPFHFLRIVWRSATRINQFINILWPFVPAAFAMFWARPDEHVWIFALSYIAMVPSAGLLGFAGQEFARKLPRVAGIVVETILGGLVEIILFMILIVRDNDASTDGHNYVPVIRAAILGSILANLLLCLGGCFIAGGIRYKEQTFHAVISEAGSGILLVAGFALLIPSAFFSSVYGRTDLVGGGDQDLLLHKTLQISRGTAIILICSFLLYIFHNAFSHDSIFDEVLASDEERDRDRHKDANKSKLTLFEAIAAIVLSLTFISFLAYFLVIEIEPLVSEHGVPDNFMGLILVPLVEKFAEHLTALDEAWDNQINFALYHCLAASIQTALFNGPLVVIVGWGMDKHMDLNFEIFMVVLLVLSIVVVGNFLRDGSSNYLEGALLVIVYIIIAVSTYFYPNAVPVEASGGESVAKRLLMTAL